MEHFDDNTNAAPIITNPTVTAHAAASKQPADAQGEASAWRCVGRVSR